MTALCSFCLLLACMFSFVKTSAKADGGLEAEFTNNGQFTVSKYNGAVPFEYVDGDAEGLPAGYEGSVMKITTTSGLAYAVLDFSASQIKSSNVESIVVRMYSSSFTLGTDEFRTNVGSDGSSQVQYGKSGYDMSSSWADITLNTTSIKTLTDANGYLANIAVGVREREQDTDSSKTIYYYIDSITVNLKEEVKPVATTKITFTGVHSYWNNLEFRESYCSIMEFSGGIGVGNLDGDYSDLLAKSTLNGAPVDTANLSFICRAWIDGEGESNIMRWTTLPASGSVLHIPAGATFTNGGEDTNVYEIAEDIYLQFNGATWAICDAPVVVETVEVSFREINIVWNNYEYDNAHCTFLEFNGGISGNGNLDANFSALISKMTLDGAAVDAANVSFYCPNWVGAEGGIIMRLATNPAAGSVLCLPAGATFTIGGSDTNVYEIAQDVCLTFNGAVWEADASSVATDKASLISPWASLDVFNSDERVLLMYDSANAWDHNDEGDLASKITYVNTQTGATMSATNDHISGWEGQKWIVLMGLTDYDKIVIAGGGTFGGNVEIPALTLYKVSGRWVTTAPANATTNYVAIAGGWNNTINGGLAHTILAFDVNPLGDAADATNLAASINRTSLMVKYNGTSFCELYATNNAYTISYAHGNQYFYFCIPETDIVEGATFEIEAGTPFAKQFLPSVQLKLTNGEWVEVKEEVEVNYAPDFVSVGTLNHYDNGAMGFGLSLVYNTTGFAASGVQVMAASYTGVTINGEMQSVALWGGDQLLFWIKREKCEAGYNGYSHATLAIAEGAKIVNAEGAEFTLGAATLYLVDGAWTTEQPADYNIFVLEPTTFVALGDCAKNAIVLQFTDNATWTEEVGAFADSVLLDGATTLTADGGSVAIDALNKTITLYVVGDYTKVEIVYGAQIAGVALPAVSAYSTESGWELTPQKTTSLVGVGVYGNNNIPVAGVYYHTVLQFSDNFVIGNSAANDATDMAEIECDVSTKVTLNGKSFYELNQENSGFYIGYVSGGAYFTFQIPQTYLDGEPENGYEYHTINIPEGTAFHDWLLPEIELISFDKVWLNSADFDPTPLEYVGIPYGWNAISNATGIDTILQFGEYGVDFLGADNGTASHADPTNVAKLASEQISTKLTINGVPVKDIDGVTVSYAHGYNFLYISIPSYELTPNDEYKCVTLHLEQNTVFKKSVLSEVTLYLLDGQWQEEKPDTVGTDAEGTYFTADQIFNGTDGEYKFTDTEESVKVISTTKAGESTIYNFLYKSDSIDFDYSLYTNVGESFGGVRVMVFRDAGETTQGFNVYVNGQMVGAKKVAFLSDEWYAIRLATSVENGKISVSVAVDGIVVIAAEVDYDGAIGDEIKFQKSYGSLSFANFKSGDIKKPTINWQGKNVYRFNVGEEKPSDTLFLRVLSALDNYDKASLTDSDFVIEWQDGAVVGGMLAAGEWTVLISIRDTSGNEARMSVQVLVYNPNEVTVSFQANGETTYALTEKGGLIAKPADPTKHGNEFVSYVFDGWYVGDTKWDFANDYALEDVALVAMFKAEYKEYTITIVSEGLETGYTYVLKLQYGSTLDQSILAREGYSYILTCGGEEIGNVTVDGDMQITVVYTANVEPEPPVSEEPDVPPTSEEEPPVSEEPDVPPTSEPETSEPETSAPATSEKKKSGCSGNVNGTLAAFALAVAASAVLFVKNTTKGGKENE